MPNTASIIVLYTFDVSKEYLIRSINPIKDKKAPTKCVRLLIGSLNFDSKLLTPFLNYNLSFKANNIKVT